MMTDEDRKQAYEEGYRAYQAGDNTDDNPYDNNDEWEQNRAWLEGYYDAAWDD